MLRKDPGGSGLGDTRLTTNKDLQGATAIGKKDASGNYIGYICVPRIHQNGFTCYIAKEQLQWTSGKPGADVADITASTVADAKTHETSHVKVYQAAGKRVSQHYGDNVFDIETKPYATKEEAEARALKLENKFYVECNSVYLSIAAKYNAKHSAFVTRSYNGGSGKEWYDPTPDWFTDQGLEAQIQAEPVNVPVPTDD